MKKSKKNKELFTNKKVELVGRFEDKTMYPHASNKLSKSLYNAVEEKLTKETKGFNALNNIQGGAVWLKF